MRASRSTAALMGLVGLLLTACTTGRATILYGPEETLTADDYPSVLKAWTRSGKIYQRLDNKLFVSATFHSPEFRRAFAVAFPDIYGHGGKITRRELVDLTGGVEQYHNFFMAVYTPDNRWNDLGKDDTIWRLTLSGAGESAVGPAEVSPIKVDENLRAVYPYITRFDKVYLVRFPLTDPLHHVVIDAATPQFSLRVASALGVAEMTWELGKAPPPQPQMPLPH
jgi:hypothetical protein